MAQRLPQPRDCKGEVADTMKQLVATLLLIATVALLVVGVTVLRPADRLSTSFGARFLAGVNYPWKSYQDFGNGAWGHSGVSTPGVQEEIDTDFANMAATGTQVVKWRMFNDTRYSPEFAPDGTVTGFDDEFMKDVDAAIDIAAKHHIYLVLSLVDSGMWTASCQRDGVQMGGHADVMSDPAKRESLIQNAIVPVVRHVARTGRVLGYEVIAEPEWGITELHTEDDGRITVPLADVQSFVKEATAAIHRNGGARVTVESNRPTNMQYWKGLGLDYYSFSWYDWMEPYDPLDVDASSYGLDRPVVLGEFPIENSQYYDYQTTLNIALGRGYAGAFAWSYDSQDKYGSVRNVHDGYAAWLADHWQEADLSRGSATPPSGQLALIPPPFAYQNVQVKRDANGITADVGLSVREGGSFHVQAYLYPVSGQPADPVADRSLSLQSGAQGILHLTMPDIPSGQVYKLSLAIFDDKWTIRKWFDSMAVFTQQNGQLVEPNLSDLDKENPCVKATP
jgi:mannan endo-1,4-beta-mannosidase